MNGNKMIHLPDPYDLPPQGYTSESLVTEITYIPFRFRAYIKEKLERRDSSFSSSTMDIIFESSRKERFTIEIGYFDSVLEIKEKVQRYHRIPVSKQTLLFKGQVLQDERDVEHCQLFHNSKVQLVIAPEIKPAVKLEQSSPPTSSPSTKIQIMVKMSSSKTSVPLEMDPTDTISMVKDKICEMEDIPVKQLAVCFNGNELQCQKSLLDSGLSDKCEIDVMIKSPPPQHQQSQSRSHVVSPSNLTRGSNSNKNNNGSSSTVSTSSNSKKLKLMVLTQCGTKKIPIEMNASDSVGELKKELQKLQQQQQHVKFHLPPEGYFFIYKQNVMEDDRSFRWHHVGNGDTIEIFNGSVTGGSS